MKSTLNATATPQALAFIVKSVQVWQLQSEKRQISQPKHTQEVHPLHVGERVQPLYTLRLARSSSSSHVILKYIREDHCEIKGQLANQLQDNADDEINH